MPGQGTDPSGEIGAKVQPPVPVRSETDASPTSHVNIPFSSVVELIPALGDAVKEGIATGVGFWFTGDKEEKLAFVTVMSPEQIARWVVQQRRLGEMAHGSARARGH